jgi:hypothetical protein
MSKLDLAPDQEALGHVKSADGLELPHLGVLAGGPGQVNDGVGGALDGR